MPTPLLQGRRPRATQRDVAREAGVSQATVSMVLGNPELASIPAETRDRILRAARGLSYAPNRSAQALKTSRTMTIACLIPDITNPFYPALLHGIQSIADDAGYDVISINSEGQPDREQRFIRWSLQGRVDGVIGVFFTLRAPDLARLTEAGVAVVRIENSQKAGGDLPIDNLFVDNRRAAAAVTLHLVERGHRRIAMIAGRGGPQNRRVDGYRASMIEAGLVPTIVTDGGFTEAGGYRAARTLLSRPAAPSAIFAANDLMAIGAMTAAKQAGLTVPADLAVAGFDDIFAARLVTPALTTVSQFQYELGRAAAETLLDRLRGAAVIAGGTSREMPFQLIAREST